MATATAWRPRVRLLALACAAVALLAACASAQERDRGAANPSTASPSSASPSSASAGPASGSTPPTAAPATPTAPAIPSIDIPVLPTPKDRGLVEGADASWPQCPPGMGIAQKRSHGAPMPLDSAEFVILGLTNGPAFYPNPCLADQVAWVRERGLLAAAYSVLSHPEDHHLEQTRQGGPFDGASRLGALRNSGYQQALFNVNTMKQAGLESPIVWLDVEPVPDFDWPADIEGNRAVVEGAIRGYTDLGYQVGVYSLESMWTRIVGDWQLGLPEWRPAGQTSREAALARCDERWMFQGGTAVMVQWVEHDRDRNLTCPGESAYLELWFHDY